MNVSSRALAGCSTGRPDFSASVLTGDGCHLSSRPRGRSGCVTTATTENCRSSASAARLGQDNSAVPMKTTFSSFIVAADVSRLIGQQHGADSRPLLQIYERSKFDDVLEDVQKCLHRRLVGVDPVDKFLAVEIDDRLGFLLVRFEPALDD